MPGRYSLTPRKAGPHAAPRLRRPRRRRVRPVRVPPAIRVPAEAVALRLDERRVLQIRPAQLS